MNDSKFLSRAEPVATLLELGPAFYDPVEPARFPVEVLRYWNDPLVRDWGWEGDFADPAARTRAFHRFEPWPQSLPQPVALRYHGHQFRHYNPDLGDGRGFTAAQLQWRGKIWDLGTKGSGTTPYSRAGDGRLTLKGAVREALATEYLEARGVLTSRTVSFFETGESLVRGDEPSPTRSAVLTRFSHSHIRIGTFQRLAFLGQKENLEVLLRYCARHLLNDSDPEGDPLALAERFLKDVSHRLAKLCASYMVTGFVHGVLNSDNINITGESFDYGPYRFLPHYDPEFTAAYFDHQGLYCFGRQPASFFWNLERLEESLAVAWPDLPAARALDDFADQFGSWLGLLLCTRLGIEPRGEAENATLVRHFYQIQEEHPTQFEQTFWDLRLSPDAEARRRASPQKSAYESASGQALLGCLDGFPPSNDADRAQEPEGPVTLLIDEIEKIWAPIAANDDWGPFEQKIRQLRSLRS